MSLSAELVVELLAVGTAGQLILVYTLVDIWGLQHRDSIGTGLWVPGLEQELREAV